jgi:hypothetical protein
VVLFVDIDRRGDCFFHGLRASWQVGEAPLYGSDAVVRMSRRFHLKSFLRVPQT